MKQVIDHYGDAIIAVISAILIAGIIILAFNTGLYDVISNWALRML